MKAVLSTYEFDDGSILTTAHDLAGGANGALLQIDDRWVPISEFDGDPLSAVRIIVSDDLEQIKAIGRELREEVLLAAAHYGLL